MEVVSRVVWGGRGRSGPRRMGRAPRRTHGLCPVRQLEDLARREGEVGSAQDPRSQAWRTGCVRRRGWWSCLSKYPRRGSSLREGQGHRRMPRLVRRGLRGAGSRQGRVPPPPLLRGGGVPRRPGRGRGVSPRLPPLQACIACAARGAAEARAWRRSDLRSRELRQELNRIRSDFERRSMSGSGGQLSLELRARRESTARSLDERLAAAIELARGCCEEHRVEVTRAVEQAIRGACAGTLKASEGWIRQFHALYRAPLPFPVVGRSDPNAHARGTLLAAERQQLATLERRALRDLRIQLLRLKADGSGGRPRPVQ